MGGIPSASDLETPVGGSGPAHGHAQGGCVVDVPSEGAVRVAVVGIGAEGWEGLSPAARREVRDAEVLMGGSRQLALVPETAATSAVARIAWPSPMLPALPALIEAHRDRAICVLASGDPMFYGVGTTLVRLLGAGRVRVVPHPSSVSLACARLGWPVEGIDVVSLVGRPLETMNAAIHQGRRLLVLSADGRTPAQVATLLVARGYGESSLTVLEQLGGPRERMLPDTAAHWAAHLRSPGTTDGTVRGTDTAAVGPEPVGAGPRVVHAPVGAATAGGAGPSAAETVIGVEGPTGFDALNVIAVECRRDLGVAPLPCVPGLPDEAFEHDGQLTKREVRAVTLSRLAPEPGGLLWDVGAGAGSIAIEWSRSHPACRAIAVESRPERAQRVGRNAAALGVPGLEIVVGTAPEALQGLEPPDAVFVGGGVTVPGVLETCWEALRPGGRLVVNAVTVESEALVTAWYGKLGGDLVRIAVTRASPVGGFTGWRPMMPVTIWAVTRP